MQSTNKLLASGLMAISLSVGTPIGKGQSLFSDPTNYPVGTAPRAIAIGDFNGDGKPDLAVANTGDPTSGDDGNVSILLGNSDGTFQSAVSLNAGKNPWSIATGDFNHDGKLDLAIRDGGESAVSILLGNGDGTFQNPVKFTVGPSGHPAEIATADFDHDGNLDLAVANSDGTISVLLGNGDGTFRQAVSYSVPLEPIALVAGDFNNDQTLDIVVSSQQIHSENYQGSLYVLLGNGDGSFQPPLAEPSIAGRSFWVASGDFNGDGQVDVVVTAQGFVVPTKIQLLFGRGDGTFQPPVDVDMPKIPGSLAYAASPVVADFNGDQKLDIAVIVHFLGSPSVQPVVRLLLGNGDGTFQAQQDISLAATPYSLSVGDFNGDNSPDVAIANENNSIAVLLNTKIASNEFALAVTTGGGGTGTVTSSPVGIDCGGACKANFLGGTTVMLSAVPDSGSTFSGWGGSCAGAATCALAMNSNASVSANFTLSSSSADFSVNAATLFLNLKRGDQATDALTTEAQGSFTGTISFTCSVSGPSPMPTCGISPVSVPPGTNATLTVNAAALTAAVTSRPFERAETLSATVVPLGLMSLVLTMCFDKKRRKLWALSPLILLATILLAACGGSSSAPPPPQNYTVTVTAQSRAIQHSTTVSVTVN
jgi:FG-GAP-like repeat/Divergent InlB B-repeat domain